MASTVLMEAALWKEQMPFCHSQGSLPYSITGQRGQGAGQVSVAEEGSR